MKNRHGKRCGKERENERTTRLARQAILLVHSAGTVASLADAAMQCVKEGETDLEAKGEKEMSEPKFTPGPLTVGPESDYFAVRDEWGNVTAFPNPGHFCEERQRANMTLYAVAPEMYDVLQHYLDLLEQANNGDGIAECKLFEDTVLIEQILKKARGEA